MNIIQNQALILLIENQTNSLQSVASTLRGAGYDVLTVSGADAGFCTARRTRPELIVCEDQLTNISSIELCYMIRADKHLQAVQFTLIGASDERDADIILEGFRAGADYYFEKNCRRQFLITKITSLIAVCRAETDLWQRSETLNHAELRLSKIIEDTYSLVATLDPAARFKAADKENIESLKMFSAKILSRKSELAIAV